MGLFGARAADILARWNPESALELSGQKTNLCSLLFQISFLAAFGLGDEKVDNWGNVGGVCCDMAVLQVRCSCYQGWSLV